MFATETDLQCLTEGFVANGVVSMTNQNYFGPGMCIHSQDHVSIQPNNGFGEGARVSMPGGINSVIIPGTNGNNALTLAEIEAKMDEIEGLSDALKDEWLEPLVFERIQNMIYELTYDRVAAASDLGSYSPPFPDVANDSLVALPDYINGTYTGPVTINVPKTRGQNSGYLIDTSLIQPNGVYRIGPENCAKNGSQQDELTIAVGQDPDGNDIPLSDVVIITDCDIKFPQGLTVVNARIITTSETANSINSPSGATFGRLDGECEDDNASVQIVTMGGMHFAAKMAAYGTQFMAMRDIQLSALESSTGSPDIKGISMVANGQIQMTSHVNAEVGCTLGDGKDELKATYIRMVL